MTLGLPWWAWIPVALTAGFLHMAVACFGQLARRRHLLTCRVYWQLRAIVHPWSFVASTVAFFAWFSLTPFRWLVLWDVGTEVRWLLAWLVRRRTLVPEMVPLPDPETGEEFVVERHHTLAGTWQQAWRHRTHDDDCEHGPTRRWFGAAARLREWRKVALRDGFAPT